MSLFAELRRRNVFRVAIFYIVSAWLLLQIADLVFELLLVPDWTLRFIFGLLVAAFPFVLFFAWAYEVTPEGIRKESEIDRSQSITGSTGRKLDIAVIVLLLAGIAVALSGQLLTGNQTSESLTANSERDRAAGSSEKQASIAVLPFEDMSAAGDQAYFGDGIAEELLNALVRIEGLQVAGRTSSFAFKDSNTDLTTIGERLGVGHILEGSVRKAGDRVRVTAQLVKAEDGFHLWSQTYDRTLDDIFAIQDEITGEIVAALRENLPGLEAEAVDTTGTDSVEAYNAFLQGRYLLHQRGTPNVRKAQELFTEAIALDPGFAEAYAALARAYSVGWGVDDYDRALEAANRALELAPDSPLSLLAYGTAEHRPDKIPDRIDALEKSLAIQPENPEAMHVLASLRINYQGDLDAALALQREAVALDPTSGIYKLWLGWYELAAGNVNAGVHSLREAHSLSPDRATLTFLLWAEATALGPGAARERLGADPVSEQLRPEQRQAIEGLLEALEGNYEAAQSLFQSMEEDKIAGGPLGSIAVQALLISGATEWADRIIGAKLDDKSPSIMLVRLRLILGYYPDIDVEGTLLPKLVESQGMPMYIFPENPPARDD